MNLAELTHKMNLFVSSKGWYSKISSRPQTPKNLAISLVLEASEVIEHFQWTETPHDKNALGEELADVMLYLLQLASICDIDLERAVLDKLEVNSHRIWDEHNTEVADSS